LGQFIAHHDPAFCTDWLVASPNARCDAVDRRAVMRRGHVCRHPHATIEGRCEPMESASVRGTRNNHMLPEAAKFRTGSAKLCSSAWQINISQSHLFVAVEYNLRHIFDYYFL